MSGVGWMGVAEVLSAGCLIAGALLNLAAGVGLVRFPDVLSRMHAATKPQVLGVLLILAGVALRLGTCPDLATLLVVGMSQLTTAPIVSHLVARAACRSGQCRPELLIVNELADASAPDPAPGSHPG